MNTSTFSYIELFIDNTERTNLGPSVKTADSMGYTIVVNHIRPPPIVPLSG